VYAAEFARTTLIGPLLEQRLAAAMSTVTRATDDLEPPPDEQASADAMAATAIRETSIEHLTVAVCALAAAHALEIARALGAALAAAGDEDDRRDAEGAGPGGAAPDERGHGGIGPATTAALRSLARLAPPSSVAPSVAPPQSKRTFHSSSGAGGGDDDDAAASARRAAAAEQRCVGLVPLATVLRTAVRLAREVTLAVLD